MSTHPGPENQQALDRLRCYLEQQFSCGTAILYGSRARGDWDLTSDIDVIAFSAAHAAGHLAHRWENFFLDLFIYPPGTEPQPDWVRLHGGQVLFQRASEADDLLASINDMVSAGPPKLSASELQTTRLWLEKMLARAEKADVEGDYRRHWLLKELLEIYFTLRGRWYLGPKQSLALLQHENPAHFTVFRQAFAPGASIADIRAAVTTANGSD